MTTKILRHLHRAQALHKASFGNIMLPWIIDPTYSASENQMTMESIKSLLHRIAHERPMHMLLCATAFWNESYKNNTGQYTIGHQDENLLGVRAWAGNQAYLMGQPFAKDGSNAQEIDKQMLHEGWTLGSKLLGYSALLERHPWAPPHDMLHANEKQGTLNHNGHVYNLTHVTESLARIGILWQHVPNSASRILEVFAEINNLMYMMTPRVILSLSEPSKAKVKQIGQKLLDTCVMHSRQGDSVVPLSFTYVPASAVAPADLVPQTADLGIPLVAGIPSGSNFRTGLP